MLMQKLLTVSELMILRLDTDNESELNACCSLKFSIGQRHTAGVVLTR